MDDKVPIKNLNIEWLNLSDNIKDAIFNFDNGRVAFHLLKEYPELSIDEACDCANVLVKVYKNKMGFSEEVH